VSRQRQGSNEEKCRRQGTRHCVSRCQLNLIAPCVNDTMHKSQKKHAYWIPDFSEFLVFTVARVQLRIVVSDGWA
jgi:hypothetical protein